jgi:phasin
VPHGYENQDHSYETRWFPKDRRPAIIPRDGGKKPTTEAADLIKNGYSTAVKGVQDYNNKFIEFAHANSNAAFDFIQKLSGAKSPSAFVELSTEYARKQLETLTEQTKQLVALSQKVTLATAEPLKTGVAKALKHDA